jgi:predicted nucleic acid-binding protein
VSVYLDASVLVALFTDDPHTARAQSSLRRHVPVVVVSDLTAAEFASAVARLVRTRDLQRAAASRCFSICDAWTAQVARRAQTTGADVSAAASLLRHLDLTLRTPDAIHIAIARRLSATLFTFDERMAKAARVLGLELLRT